MSLGCTLSSKARVWQVPCCSAEVPVLPVISLHSTSIYPRDVTQAAFARLFCIVPCLCSWSQDAMPSRLPMQVSPVVQSCNEWKVGRHKAEIQSVCRGLWSTWLRIRCRLTSVSGLWRRRWFMSRKRRKVAATELPTLQARNASWFTRLAACLFVRRWYSDGSSSNKFVFLSVSWLDAYLSDVSRW